MNPHANSLRMTLMSTRGFFCGGSTTTCFEEFNMAALECTQSKINIAERLCLVSTVYVTLQQGTVAFITKEQLTQIKVFDVTLSTYIHTTRQQHQ